MSRVLKCCELTLIITGILATGACTSTTVTLAPERLASVRYGSEAEPFGVCVGLDGRGGGLRAWDEFLSLRENSRLDLEGAHMAGYEASVLRGDSCHRRNLVNFQAAIWFDLSEIPEGAAVESAILNVNNTWPSEFLRGDWESETEIAQCTVFMIGEAEEEWAGGIFFGGVSEFAEADGDRLLDLRAGDDDRIAHDGGRCFDKSLVLAGDFKPVDRLLVARGQSAARVMEVNRNIGVVDRVVAEEWAAVDELLSPVGLGECPAGQAMADRAFVGRM